MAANLAGLSIPICRSLPITQNECRFTQRGEKPVLVAMRSSQAQTQNSDLFSQAHRALGFSDEQRGRCCVDPGPITAFELIRVRVDFRGTRKKLPRLAQSL